MTGRWVSEDGDMNGVVCGELTVRVRKCISEAVGATRCDGVAYQPERRKQVAMFREEMSY